MKQQGVRAECKVATRAKSEGLLPWGENNPHSGELRGDLSKF